MNSNSLATKRQLSGTPHRTNLCESEIRFHEFRTIPEQESDSFSFRDTFGQERVCKLARPSIQFSKRESFQSHTVNEGVAIRAEQSAPGKPRSDIGFSRFVGRSLVIIRWIVCCARCLPLARDAEVSFARGDARQENSYSILHVLDSISWCSYWASPRALLFGVIGSLPPKENTICVSHRTRCVRVQVDGVGVEWSIDIENETVAKICTKSVHRMCRRDSYRKRTRTEQCKNNSTRSGQSLKRPD